MCRSENWVEVCPRSVGWFKQGQFMKFYFDGPKQPYEMLSRFAKFEGGKWYVPEKTQQNITAWLSKAASAS